MPASGAVNLDVAGIARLAGIFGVPAGSVDLSALARFGELFLRWNSHINLASARTGDELVERHFSDAFAAARFVEPGDRVADVGTGGGLPAIPLALLCPRATLDLFEPLAKKQAFLRTAVRELGLGPRVTVHGRALALGTGGDDATRGAFDVAMSRATFAPADWLSLGRALAKPGGRVLVFAAGSSGDGLPTEAARLDYDRNRRLLVF